MAFQGEVGGQTGIGSWIYFWEIGEVPKLEIVYI